jgi:twitching motility protein PilU
VSDERGPLHEARGEGRRLGPPEAAHGGARPGEHGELRRATAALAATLSPAPHPPAPGLDDLLARAAALDAIDLFLIAGAPPVVNVAGRQQPLDPRPLAPADLERLAAPLLTGERAARFAERPDLDLARAVPAGRFRLNVFRQRGLVSIVARRVRTEIPSLEALGLPALLGDLALEPRGLFLVTGAASTGKSTTLAAMLERRSAAREGHIVTIEDPIEFLHPHRRSIVTQREVGLDTASYPDALRSALRQAPDVLVLGEVRDRETAESALRFADTGHLVLATLHATNTVQALERVVSLFPADLHAHVHMLLSLALVGVVSQRLLPRADRPGERVAAVEVLEPTQRVRDSIRRGDWPSVRVALREGGGGMTSFDEALHRLVRAGTVARDDAVRAADSPTDLLLRLRLEEAGGPNIAERRRLRLV